MAQEPRAQSFAISNFFLAHTGWNEWPGDFTRDKESQAESLSFTISTRWHEWPGVLEPPYASSATGSFAANTAFSNSIDSEESAGFSVESDSSRSYPIRPHSSGPPRTPFEYLWRSPI